MEDVPGGEIAGLELGPQIGRGGMGVVLRAYDPALDRMRAVKLLSAERSADPRFRERFRRESQLAASIEHPNVVAVLRAGETTEGRLFCVMRLVDGPSLREVIAAEGSLRADRVAALALELGAGLDAAHAAGLIHRDVKPANVLLEARDNGAEQAFLCDFGISRLADRAEEGLTETGEFLGSVDYVAPEQIRGETVDRRADVYSLACVLFHALTGRAPFAGREQLATMFAHASAERPRPSELRPELPRALDVAISRGMSIAPGERQPSAGALAADVAEALRGGASEAPTRRLSRPSGIGIRLPDPADPLASARRFSLVRGGRRMGALAVVGVVLAGLVIAVALGTEPDSPSPGDPPIELPATARVAVPSGPVALAEGPQRTWVVSPNREERSATPIDQVSGTAGEPVRIGGEPVAVAVGFDSVWIADRAGSELVRLDPESGEIRERIPVGAGPADIEIGDRAVWVANRDSDSVTKLSPDGEQLAEVRVGPLPSGLTLESGDLWVANLGDGSVSRIDARSARPIGNPIDAGQSPNAIASAAGRVWVSDNFDGTVRPISAATGEVGEPVEVGPKPRGLIAGSDYVWTASREDSTLTRIDPEDRETVTFEVGGRPNDVALGDGELLVASFGESVIESYGR